MVSGDESQQVRLMEGISAFQSARMRAFWDDILNHLRGKPAELLSFDDVKERLRLREESYKGLQNVPIDQIAGSVGRYRDFTSSFLPKSGKMQERWSRVYAEANGMRGLPPIELYKVGDVYFVRDGNHRVSVARRMGAKTIEAHVTELQTPIELHPGMSAQELDDAACYADFVTVTGLQRTRPHHQPIILSEPSRYSDLLGHIHLQRSFLEKARGQEVSIEEAAADWYDNVYRPAVSLIRKYDMLRHDSNRTEGDLYLWLVDHLSEVKEAYGNQAPARTFSDALVDFLSERRIPVPKDLLQEDDSSVILTRPEVKRMLEEYQERERIAEGVINGNGH